MIGSEAPRCAFAMDKQLTTGAMDDVPFNLAGIVGYIVQERELYIGDDFAEGVPNQMGNDLPVRQSAIGGGPHGAQILLAQF